MLSKEDIIKNEGGPYKHCNISRASEAVWVHNPISGHSYVASHQLKKGYQVAGGFLIGRSYMSLESAMEAVDFDWKFMTSDDRYRVISMNGARWYEMFHEAYGDDWAYIIC